MSIVIRVMPQECQEMSGFDTHADAMQPCTGKPPKVDLLNTLKSATLRTTP
jgi:hypothetical protein